MRITFRPHDEPSDAPTRVQFVPHLIHDDDELEHLIIGAVLVGVTGALRRNPALSAAAQRVIHAMSSHDIGGREPTAD